MEYGFIYVIENKENGKKYIGQTCNKYPNTRWSAHKNDAKNGLNRPLYNAIRKYGETSFVFKILLKNVPIEKLDFYEKLWIKKFKTRIPNGYNISIGGSVLRGKDNPMFGVPSKFKGVKRTEEVKIKIKEKWTNERRKKQSDKFSGNNNPMYGIHNCGENNPNYNKKISDETKRKISESLSGEKNGFYGKTHTNETKNIISQYQNKNKKSIAMMDSITEEIIIIFNSISDAKRYIIENTNYKKADDSAISKCARGICSIIYGYKWKFIEKCND